MFAALIVAFASGECILQPVVMCAHTQKDFMLICIRWWICSFHAHVDRLLRSLLYTFIYIYIFIIAMKFFVQFLL